MGGIALDGFGLGLLLGFAAGLGTGISIGKKQKPWSELTAAEKKPTILSRNLLTRMPYVPGGIIKRF